MNERNRIKMYDAQALYYNSPDKTTHFTIVADGTNNISFLEVMKFKETKIAAAHYIDSVSSEASTFDTAVLDASDFSGAVVLSGRVESVSGTPNIQPQVLIFRGTGYNNGSADEGWEVQNLGSAISATGNFILDISTSSYWQNQPSRYIKFRFVETGVQENKYYVTLTVTSLGV